MLSLISEKSNTAIDLMRNENEPIFTNILNQYSGKVKSKTDVRYSSLNYLYFDTIDQILILKIYSLTFILKALIRECLFGQNRHDKYQDLFFS